MAITNHKIRFFDKLFTAFGSTHPFYFLLFGLVPVASLNFYAGRRETCPLAGKINDSHTLRVRYFLHDGIVGTKGNWFHGLHIEKSKRALALIE
jgi:hypothetical protein